MVKRCFIISNFNVDKIVDIIDNKFFFSLIIEFEKLLNFIKIVLAIVIIIFVKNLRLKNFLKKSYFFKIVNNGCKLWRIVIELVILVWDSD